MPLILFKILISIFLNEFMQVYACINAFKLSVNQMKCKKVLTFANLYICNNYKFLCGAV